MKHPFTFHSLLRSVDFLLTFYGKCYAVYSFMGWNIGATPLEVEMLSIKIWEEKHGWNIFSDNSHFGDTLLAFGCILNLPYLHIVIWLWSWISLCPVRCYPFGASNELLWRLKSLPVSGLNSLPRNASIFHFPCNLRCIEKMSKEDLL